MKMMHTGVAINRIHALLGIQSLLAILVSINRLGTWILGYVLPNEFLRWVDLNNIAHFAGQPCRCVSAQENHRI